MRPLPAWPSATNTTPHQTLPTDAVNRAGHAPHAARSCRQQEYRWNMCVLHSELSAHLPRRQYSTAATKLSCVQFTISASPGFPDNRGGPAYCPSRACMTTCPQPPSCSAAQHTDQRLGWVSLAATLLQGVTPTQYVRQHACRPMHRDTAARRLESRAAQIQHHVHCSMLPARRISHHSQGSVTALV